MKNYLFQRTSALSLFLLCLVLGSVIQVSAIAQGTPSNKDLYWYIAMPANHANSAAVGNSVDGNNTLGLISTAQAPASSTFVPSTVTETGFPRVQLNWDVPNSLRGPQGNGPFVFGNWADRQNPYWWSVSIYNKNELSKDIDEIRSISVNVVGNYPFNSSGYAGDQEAQDFVVFVYETTKDTIETGNVLNAANDRIHGYNCMYLPTHIDNNYNMNELLSPTQTIRFPTQYQNLGEALTTQYIYDDWLTHGAFLIERKTLKIADFKNDAWIEFKVPAEQAGYKYKGNNLVVVMLQIDRVYPESIQGAGINDQTDAGNSLYSPMSIGSHYIRNYNQQKTSWFARKNYLTLQTPQTYNWYTLSGFNFNTSEAPAFAYNQGYASWALRLGVDAVVNNYTGTIPQEAQAVALATPNIHPRVEYNIPTGADRSYDVAMFSYKIINADGDVVYRALSGTDERNDTLFTAIPNQTSIEFVNSTGLYSDGDGGFVLTPASVSQTQAEAGDYKAIITWQTFRSNSTGQDLTRKGVWPTRAQQVIEVPFSIILPVAKVEGAHPTWNTTIPVSGTIEQVSQPGLVVNAIVEGSPMPLVKYSVAKAAPNAITGDMTELGDVVYTALDANGQDQFAVELPQGQTRGRFTFNFVNAMGDIAGTDGQFDASKLAVGKYYISLDADYGIGNPENISNLKYDSFWVAYPYELELVSLVSPRTTTVQAEATTNNQYVFPAETDLRLEYSVTNWGAKDCDAHIFTAEIYRNGALSQTIIDTNTTNTIRFASSDIFTSNKTFRIPAGAEGIYTIKVRVDILAEANRALEQNKNDNSFPVATSTASRYFRIQAPYNITIANGQVAPMANDYRYPQYPTIKVTNNGSADINGLEINLVVTNPEGAVIINETKPLSNIVGTTPTDFKFDTLFFPEELGRYTFTYTYQLPGAAAPSTPSVRTSTIQPGLGNENGSFVIRNTGELKIYMDRLYRNGVKNNIVFELDPSQTSGRYVLDASYLDFRSKIVGAGPDATITFRPSARLMNESTPIVLEIDPSVFAANGDGLRADDWYGIAFGDSPVSRLDTAAVNKVVEPEWKRYFAESNGHIIIDGGPRKNIQIEFKGGFTEAGSNKWLAAPVYLGSGANNITIKNCRIISPEEAMRSSSTVPAIYYDDNNSSLYHAGFRYEALSLEDGTANINTTAGIFMFTRPLDDIRIDNVNYNFNRNTSDNNVIEGNVIEGFGYGVFSLGMGADIVNNTIVPRYNKGTVISNNLIKSSGQSGIFLGFEDGATVSGNRIYNITTATGDVHGISVGQASTENSTAFDGVQLNMNNYNVTIERNEISGVRAQANQRAYGILVTEPVDALQYYGRQIVPLDQLRDSYSTVSQPATNDLYKIINNLIYEIVSIGGTDLIVGKSGIAVLPSKAGKGVLADNEYDISQRKVNKVLVANNTVIIDDETAVNLNVDCSGFNVSGIKLFDVNNYEIINNAIAIKIDTSYKYDYISALALRSQNPRIVPNNITVNNNAYSIFESITYPNAATVSNENSAFVRFFELDKYGRLLNEEGSTATEYNNLRNWYAWTGSDKNSIIYNFLADMQARTGLDLATFWSGDATTIRRMLPMNNKLTQLDKGFVLSYVLNDINGTSRHLLGKRFNIGAIEFTSQHANYDVMILAISNPVAYLDPSANYSTQSEEQVMLTYDHATNGVRPTAIVKNDGIVSLANVPIVCTITSSEYPFPVMRDTVLVTLPIGSEKEITFFTSPSKRFIPSAYSETTISAANISAKYASMKRNITPVYRTEVRVASIYSSTIGDANRQNDIRTISSRFFIPRSEKSLLVSAKHSHMNLYTSTEATETNKEIIAGRLNYDTVISALSAIGYTMPLSEGSPIYYDVLERTAWEPRSTVYDQYSGVIYSDALNDEMDYWEKKPLLDYVSKATVSNKRSLIIGSEGLLSANYSMADPFDKELADNVLRSNNPTTVTWAGPLYITGAAHNMNTDIEITNTGYEAKDAAEQIIGDEGPHPKSFKMIDTIIGINRIAYYQKNTENILVMTSKTTERNAVHAAIDWRHLRNAGLFMEGIFGDIGGDINKPDPSLDINLADLNANAIGKKVVVEWTTLNESGIANFEVQRADVYNSLAGLFASINSKRAKGLINTEANYSIFDENVEYGKEYAYRLKINNVDGQYTYSYAKNVSIEYADGMKFGIVKPNPVLNSASTELMLTKDANVNVTINDLSGREVMSIFKGIAAAGTTYSLDIDAANLAAGTYTVIYNIDGNVVKTEMFNVAK